VPEYRRIEHGPLLGLNEDDNKMALLSGELQTAVNVYHEGTLLHTRPGFIQEPDAVAGSAGFATDDIPAPLKPIEGMFEFRKEFGAGRTLMVVHNGLVYKEFFTPTSYALGNTTIAVTADNATGSPWVMAQHRNVVFGAGGIPQDDAWALSDPSGTPTMIRLQVEASTGVPSTGNAFTPKLVFEKWNYVFCAQFYNAASGTTSSTVSSDSNANPLVVRYSDLGSIDATSIDTLGASFPYSNAIGGPGIGGLSGNFGDWITGFGEYTDNNGDWLIIGTNSRLYSVRQTQFGDRPFAITDEIPNGLAHQRAFVSLGVDSGDAIYMSPLGIHSLRQSQNFGAKANAYLSWPIRKTFDTINKTRLNQVVGGYWQREGVVVFAVPTFTSAKNDTLLAMDIKNVQGDITSENVRWYKWDLNNVDEDISTIAVMRDSNDEIFIYAGTRAQRIVITMWWGERSSSEMSTQR
jgi:hypothetical protein